MDIRQCARGLAAGFCSLVLAMGVWGCGDRKADVETPTASAEVKTKLDAAQIPKEQLESAAANAAVAASEPGRNTVLPEGADPSDPLLQVAP